MTHIITLRLSGRRDADQVDLDELTPRARALAEAFGDSFDHQALDVLLECRDAHGEIQHARTRAWSRFPADSAMSATEWLEREATSLPVGSYAVAAAPMGGPRGPRVPSADAAAADLYLTRTQVLDHMRRRGADLGTQGWDTLRGTGHLPEPDRYVCRQPQWRPASVDAYIDRPYGRWTISRVATYLGYDGPSATGTARRQLSRWGLPSVGRGPGRGGEGLYAADQVIAAHTHRPGRGRQRGATDEAGF